MLKSGMMNIRSRMTMITFRMDNSERILPIFDSLLRAAYNSSSSMCISDSRIWLLVSSIGISSDGLMVS